MYTQTITPERQARLNDYNTDRLEASYFDVKKVAMGNKRYAIVNTVTGQKLSEVSKRYTLVKNRDVFEPFVKQFGVEAIRKFYGYGNAKYFYMEIETGRKFNFGTDEAPDMVNEVLCIANSYNKTKSFSFRLGAFRWVCANGLHSGEALVNYKKIHVGVIPITKLVFQALLKYQDNTFETWKNLKEVELPLARRIGIVEGMNIFDETDKNGKPLDNNRILNARIKRQAISNLNRNYNQVDNQENGWGLYNQINSAIDYHIGGKSQIDKRITANKRMEKYLVSNVIEQNYGVGVYLN